jgi:hypothetical protein
MFTLVGRLNADGEFSPSRIHGYSEEERTEDKQDVKVVDCFPTAAVFRVTVTTTENGTSTSVHQLDKATGLFQEIPGAVLPAFSKAHSWQQKWMTKRAAKWAPGMVVTRNELENASADNETTCDKPTAEVGNSEPVSASKEHLQDSEKHVPHVKKAQDKPTNKVGNSEPVSKPKVRIPDPGKYAPQAKKTNLNREKDNAAASMPGSIYLSLEEIQPELQRHGLALMFTAGKFRIVNVRELVSGV